MKNSTNLWPDLEVDTITTPRSILKEQAMFLGKKTKNIVIGEVYSDSKKEDEKDLFLNRFYLVAPALANYSYLLFTMQHDILLYPGTIYYQNRKIDFNDEEQLIVEIEKIFNDNTTKRILQNLISQSK